MLPRVQFRPAWRAEQTRGKGTTNIGLPHRGRGSTRAGNSLQTLPETHEDPTYAFFCPDIGEGMLKRMRRHLHSLGGANP